MKLGLKRPSNFPMAVIAIAYTLCLVIPGCKAYQARATGYGFELEECNRGAMTCAESIACENKVRARYNRQPRTGDCQ